MINPGDLGLQEAEARTLRQHLQVSGLMVAAPRTPEPKQRQPKNTKPNPIFSLPGVGLQIHTALTQAQGTIQPRTTVLCAGGSTSNPKFIGGKKPEEVFGTGGRTEF